MIAPSFDAPFIVYSLLYKHRYRWEEILRHFYAKFYFWHERCVERWTT